MSTDGRGSLPASKRKPHTSRLAPNHPFYDRILAAHEAAMEQGEAMYLDPYTGLWVQTAQSIWESRDCCDLGCRHCPFLEE